MLKRDLIRFKIIYIVILLMIIVIGGLIGVIFSINKYMDTQIKLNTKIRDDAKSEYEKTIYIEKNIESFYNFIKKFKTFDSISINTLKTELSFLIPSNVKINELELSLDGGKIKGSTTDYRTTDLISNTFKTYSSLYGSIDNVTITSSSKTSPTNVDFSIEFQINKEKLRNKIYSDDIDGDGVQDYNIINVDVGGVKQNKKVINDECPLTPNNFVVIGKMLEQNPTLIDIYDKYKQMYNEGYFTLMDNGCLKKGDYNILQN